MRTCNRCNESKSVDDFAYDMRKGVKHLRTYCKSCKPKSSVANRKAYDQRYKETNLESYQRSQRKYRWKILGIDPDKAETYYQSHNGQCDICQSKTALRLCVDHDHVTGDIRGMLCSPCNRAIGALGDTYESVMRAANYLLTARMTTN